MNEELKIIISAEIAKLKQDLAKGRKELENFEQTGTESSEKVSGSMKSMGQGISTAMGAVGIAVGIITAAGGAMFALVEGTEAYTRGQAKLATAFETTNKSAAEATQTYNDLYRVIGDEDVAVEAAGHLAQLADNQEQLSEWTNICQGVYATFGDSLPIESLTEAANETAKTGELTGALADALNWAGVNEEEFAEKLFWCNTEAEREALIRSTLTGLYDDAAKSYEKTAADLLAANEAQAALTDATAALGEILRPVVTLLKGGLAQVLTDLLPHLTLIAEGISDMANGVEGGGDKIAEGLTTILTGIYDKVIELIPTFLTVGTDMVMALLTGIVEALPQIVTAILEMYPSYIQTLMTIVLGIVEALPGLIEIILLALPGIAVNIVESVVKLIPLLINGVLQLVLGIVKALPGIITNIIRVLPQLITTLVVGLVGALPLLLEGVIELILGIVDALPDLIVAIYAAIPSLIGGLLVAVLECLPAILAAVVKLVAQLVAAIPRILISLVTAIVNIYLGMWDTIVGIFKGAPEWFKNTWTKVSTAWKNAFSGIGDFFKDLWNKVKNAFSGAKTWFKDTFGKIGTAIGDSLSGSVKAAINGILSSAAKLINGFINSINAAISIINKIPGVNIKKLSQLNVPKLAKGAVVDSATLAMIGENGKEAVVPLENNTEWLDGIAERLAAMIGGTNTPIYLQIDGKTFAQLSVDNINKLTRQRGSLPLVLA